MASRRVPIDCRPVLAERVSRPEGVNVWREGDEVLSFYEPDTPGYARYAALADKQAGSKAER